MRQRQRQRKRQRQTLGTVDSVKKLVNVIVIYKWMQAWYYDKIL